MAPPPKRKLLAWLPTVILSVAVVGVLVTAGVLIGNGLGGPTPRPTYGQVTDLNALFIERQDEAPAARFE